jgi:mono/diheme cytochrome c family protein
MEHSRILRGLALLLIALFSVLVAAAATQINPKRGKVYFKKECRVCHNGSEGIVKLEPVAKTMKQWESAFAKGGKVEACLARVKEKLGEPPTEQDLLDMQAYLVQHAADSDQPASCGN